MSTYVCLIKFTREGLMTIQADSPERQKTMHNRIEEAGGTIVGVYHCLGQYDTVMIVEYPDNEAALLASIAVGMQGHIEITTLPAIDHYRWTQIVK